MLPKRVLHVQRCYISLFISSDHCFLALSLLLIVIKDTRKKQWSQNSHHFPNFYFLGTFSLLFSCCLSSLLSLSLIERLQSVETGRTDQPDSQMDGVISAANSELFVSQLALHWKDDQFGDNQHSHFDRMGHLQLSDHLVRNRQTGEQMRHRDMLNKGKLLCPSASFTLQFDDLYHMIAQLQKAHWRVPFADWLIQLVSTLRSIL